MHAFDAHHPTEPGHIKHIVRKDAEGKEYKVYVNPGQWREIPYRALLVKGLENLLVAGRNVSADFMGQSGIRLVLECLNMGQAAGTAAAMAVKAGITARQLDAQTLRKQLIAQGIPLDRVPTHGQGGISVNVKFKPEDLIFPEQNKSGQSTVVLTEEAKKKYGLDVGKIEKDNMEKYLTEHGYTDNGGDVGTNLE